MARTTLDIDGPLLRELKQLQKKQQKTLGQLVSELLASALSAQRKKEGERRPPAFEWNAQEMRPRVNLADKEALWELLDREGTKRP